MIRSPYATKFTREQMDGKADPKIDGTNYMAKEKPARTRAWERREAAKKAAKK